MGGAGNITIGNFTFISINSFNRSVTQTGAQFFLNTGVPGLASQILLTGNGSGGVLFNNNQVLNLVSNLTLTNNNTGGGMLTIEGNLIGNGSVTVRGNVTFNGTSKIYSGPTIVESGRLTLSSTGLVNSSSVTVQSGAQLRFSGTNALGTGLITLNGGGDGTNGALRLQSGTQTINNPIHFGSDATIHTEGGGSNLTVGAAGNLTGSAVLTKTGGGTLNLAAPNSATLGLRVTGGTLNLVTQPARTVASLSSSSGTTLNFGTTALTVNQNGDTEFNGVLTGSGQFTKTGIGELRLDNIANTLSGPVVVSGGTLAIRTGGSLGTASSITVNPEGTLRLRIPNSATSDQTYNLPANVTLAGGTLERGGGHLGYTAILTSNVVVTADSSLRATDGRLFRIDGGITGGSYVLRKGGSGTVILNGTISPTLGFDVRSGTLDFGATNRTISFLEVDDDAKAVLGGQLTVDQNRNSRVQGELVGPGGITKSGSGTLAFTSMPKSYTGPTIINGGTLRMSGSGQAKNTSKVQINSGGTLELSSDTVYEIGPGPVILNGGRLFSSSSEPGDVVRLKNRVEVQAASSVEVAGQSVLVMDGDLSGGGNINKGGSGFLLLRGSRSGYSGQFVGSNVIIPVEIRIPRGGLHSLHSADPEGITYEFNDLTGSGGVRKTGPGRTTLLGRNSFTGPLRIEQGRLDIGTDESLGNPSRIEFYGDKTALSVSGGSTVVVNAPIRGNAGNLGGHTQIRLGAGGGSTLILNQPISGRTHVRFASGGSGGNGTIVLNAQSRYTGHTTINNGELGIVRLGIDNALPPTTRLRFGDEDNPNPTGRLDLNGYSQTLASLEKNNAAEVRNGGILNSSERTSTLTLNQETNTFFDGPFEGKINFIKRGQGKLTWQADSPNWLGTLSVERGAVALNGSAPNATVLVGEEGYFGGYAYVKEIINSGVVSPGNSPGKITVQGDYTQTSRGKLVMELSGTRSGEYDQLHVLGKGNLDGTLSLRLDNFIPKAGDEFPELLRFEGGRSGAFARLETSPLVDYSLSENATSTSARVERVNFVSGRLGGLGPNQREIAEFLQKEYEAGIRDRQFGESQSVLMKAALGFNSPEKVRDVYQQIAADEAGVLPVLAFQQANTMFSWLQGRVDGLRYGSAGTMAQGMDWFRPQNAPLWSGEGLLNWRDGKPEYVTGVEWSAYGSGIFTSGRKEATGASGEFLSQTLGGAFGVDFRLPSGVMGLFGGYTDLSVQFPETASQVEADSAFFGTHLTWLFGNINVTGALAYTYMAPTWERRIPVLGETALGKTDAHMFSALLSTSYDFKGYGWLVSPTLSLHYSQLFVDGWREKGSAAAQSFDSFSVPSLQLGTGIRIAKVLPSASVTLIPEVRAGWQFEMLGDSRNVGAQLATGSQSFSMVTESVSRNAGVFGAGLTAVFNDAVSLYIDYSASLGSNQQVLQTAYAGLRYYFPGGPSQASWYELPDDKPDWLDSIMATPPANFLKQLGFTGRFQVQYAQLRTDAEGDKVTNPPNFDQLFIRRLYFGVQRELLSRVNLSFTLKYDPSEVGEELSIFDATLAWQPVDWFGVRVGYDKVPFGWEETTSSRVLKTIERSPATRFIGGLGGDSEVAGAKNHIALFGEIPHPFGQAYYDVALAYPTDKPSGLFKSTAGNELYYYARVGNVLPTSFGTFDLGADVAFMPTDFRGRGGATATAYAAHLQYDWHAFRVVAEFLAAHYEDEPGDPIGNPMGFYITSSYFLTPQIELVGQFAWLDGQGTHDIRLNQVIPKAPTNYPNSREFDNLYYWYLGFNYYIRGNSVKFQAGLQWSEASGVRLNRGLITQAEQTFGARAQLQILW